VHSLKSKYTRDGFVDVEGVARELLAMGYVVQVRDGCNKVKDSKNCLRNLRHRFIVCLGFKSVHDQDGTYLHQPLVVEPQLRDQFVIAHPTPSYESLMQVCCFSCPLTWCCSRCMHSSLVAVTHQHLHRCVRLDASIHLHDALHIASYRQT
jgi:hypothetical protein